MNYDSVANQAYNLLHFAFAFWLLYWSWTRFSFAESSGDKLERAIHLFVKASFFYIVAGYLLVVTRLFEVMSIFIVVVAFTAHTTMRRGGGAKWKEGVPRLTHRFYDLLESGFLIRQWVAKVRGKGVLAVKRFQPPHATSGQPDDGSAGLRSGTGAFLESLLKRRAPFLLLAFVTASSAYIRFYDAVKYAASPLSDSYVTLAWMKYIERRQLFHDGFYPAGLHITLAYLHKFAAIDQLYVLKYMGPTISMLVMLGIYFAVSRLSGNRYAGILSAALYGWAGYLFLGSGWERQIGTNSQEFALVFVLPAFYFAIRYLMTGKRNLLMATLAACAVPGFSHTWIYAYLAMGVACAVAASLVFSFRESKLRCLHIALVGVASALLTYAQLPLAQLLYRLDLIENEKNAGVEDFLNTRIDVPPTELHVWDYAALAGIVLTLASGLISRKKLKDRLPEFAVAFFGAASLLLYRYGATITHLQVVLARASDVWVIGAVLCIGMGAASAWRLLRVIRLPKLIEPLLCFALLLALWNAYPPKPIQAYKLEWESGVRQYLRIANEFLPKTWTIFSQNEGYDLVLGNGLHAYLRDFLDMYDPAAPNEFPTRRGQSEPDKNIAPDAFVFHEKTVFRVSESNSIYSLLEPIYEQREKDNADFKNWLAVYEQTHHHPPEIYYEDDHLAVYYFRLERDPLNTPEAVWNGPEPLQRLQN